MVELYEFGSEGPQWWADYEDNVRDLPARGILDRCRRSDTCPKIIEHSGAAGTWELRSRDQHPLANSAMRYLPFARRASPTTGRSGSIRPGQRVQDSGGQDHYTAKREVPYHR